MRGISLLNDERLAINSYLLSNGCTIKYSKKNIKIYIKIKILLGIFNCASVG
jgi:hypothetical protein